MLWQLRTTVDTQCKVPVWQCNVFAFCVIRATDLIHSPFVENGYGCNDTASVICHLPNSPGEQGEGERLVAGVPGAMHRSKTVQYVR